MMGRAIYFGICMQESYRATGFVYLRKHRFFLRKPLDAVARSEHRYWSAIARKRTQSIAESLEETVTATIKICGRAPNRMFNTSQTHTKADFFRVYTPRLPGI